MWIEDARRSRLRVPLSWQRPRSPGSRGRSGVRYPYFFCLGRQERLKSCRQPLVRVEREAETIIQRHVAQLSDIDRGIDATLLLLMRPGDFYAGGSRAIQRLMVQELSDRIWIVDDRVAGADLRRPFWQGRS